MISSAQLRAARGLLGWTPRELAKKATVTVATVYALEDARRLPTNDDALAAVQTTLESQGIEFLNEDAPGVRLHWKKRK